MRRVVLAGLLVLFLAVPSFATVHPPEKPSVTNITNVTNVTNLTEVEHNAFDYGAYLDVVMFETKNTEWGTRATYLYESNETRVYVGGKIYLDRLLTGK
jgi:hypothetical protein